MKRISTLTIACLGLLLMTGSCGKNDSATQDVTKVKLYKVEAAGPTTTQEFPGRVKASEEVNMSFKVSGTLIRLHVGEGSRVHRGQLIAELDPRDYQVQKDAVEAEYHRIKSEADRVIALYSDSVSTADAYDQARYGLQQITAKYENAKNQLADTKIYAPFDGSVQKKMFDAPTVIAAGMPVVSLISDGGTEIEINIPASAYVERNKMTTFSASFDFIQGTTVPLQLISVAPKANANQLYTMRLSVPRNVSPQPTPGMSTMVSVAYAGSDAVKTQVPASALFNAGDKSAVWVYNAEAKTIAQREVVVERLHTDGTAIISSGLSAGDMVVTAGVHKLKNNQQVEPVKEASATNVGGLL